MRNPRNQLIIAIVFAVLLGLIIVVAARCSSSGTPVTRTPVASKTVTPKTTGTPGLSTGAVVTGTARATDVTIAPPGGQPTPSVTPISVGPLPATSPVSVGVTSPVAPAPVVVVVTATPIVVPAGGATYIVKTGDTLASIAKMYGVTTAAIAQANGITIASLIRAGQKLVIPGAKTPATTTTASRTYIVQSGDNLSRIAAKYGTTVSAIAKANNITNPSLIRVGQKLIIP